MFCLTCPLLAQEYSPLTIYTGLRGGYFRFYPRDSQIADYYKGGMLWGGFVSFSSENGLGLDFNIDYYSEGNQNPVAPSGTALNIIPVTSSLKFNFFQGNAISPYLGGGIGLYMISEADPDFTYLPRTYKFGKHILAGIDICFPQTVLKLEARQTFIDEVSSSLYYRANFGGLSATVGIAFAIFPQPEVAKERDLYFERERRLRSVKDLERRLETLERGPFLPTSYYYNEPLRQEEIERIKIQLESEKQRAEELAKKLEEERKTKELKREEYLKEKLEKRQEKKEEMLKK